ncbi:MAG: zinc-binding dehydrogenase [Verrucomicrobiia bacterium]
MRAAILYGKEEIRVEDRPPAPLKPGEVRIAIEAALTCGTDLKVYRRGYHAKMIKPPAVFGHELSGVICEVHPATERWSVGQRVVAANSAPCGSCLQCQNGQANLCDDLVFLNGAYAESIVVPARIVDANLLELRPETPFGDACLTEPLACVVQGIEDLQLAGGRVLVLGAGPIGLMFVALAHNFGAEVTVAGRGEARLAAARRLGASTVVEIPPQADTAPMVRLRAGAAFDAVIEAVGRPETWEAAVQLVRKGGKVNFFGGCPSGSIVSLDTGLLHYSGLTLLASFHHSPQTIRKALQLIESGVIRAADFVDGECPLTHLPGLFRQMAAGNRAVKTLIRVRD